LTFDYGAVERDYSDPNAVLRQERAEISAIGGDEAIRRAGGVERIVRAYVERYGQPFFTSGDSKLFLQEGARWWQYDLIHQEAWIAGATWKWRERGQQVKLAAYLLCRGGIVTVEYSLEDHSF
jgi:hypothetical protein